MNILDALIIFFLIGALVRGTDLGFVRQLLSTVGFIIGLFIGAAIEPHVVNLAHSQLSRLEVTLITVLGMALLLLAIGEAIGIVIKNKLQLEKSLNRIDNGLGALIAGLSLLVTIWLGSSFIVTLPFPDIQTLFRGSAIVSLLDRNLPQPPDVVAGLGYLIAPNGFPNVFIGGEPVPNLTTLPTPAQLAAAVKKDSASVVKIEGDGCGGVVTGSGFVVGADRVATNAHVVAGISSPVVIDGNGAHYATTIWFDPNLDFAVLQVNDLAGKPLPLDTASIPYATPAGVLGYPGGGDFSASSAAVLKELTARGRNIYNQGDTIRDIYSVQADVIPGNSGGPLVNTNGDVIGVVFATSTQYNDLGYALGMSQVVKEINQASTSNRPVSSGTCAD